MMSDTDGRGTKRSQPKYEAAKATLRRRVESMPAGAKLPSLQVLCEELEMSLGTVMRAIRELAEEGTIERRKNRGAFVGRGREKRNVLVVWPDFVERVSGQPITIHSYTSRILHAVQAAAAQLNRNLLVAPRLAVQGASFDMTANGVSGVLVLFNCERSLVESYLERRIPLVLVKPLVRVPGAPFVATDHCAETQHATLSLVRRGHKRIVYVAVDQHVEIPNVEHSEVAANFVVEERVRGYRLAMREAGLEQNIYVHSGPARVWDKADRDRLYEVLRETGATACCCFNDDLAGRVYQTCREHRLSIPGDLSVIGHDDADIARALQPGLTTIEAPLEELGRQAVRLLNEYMEGGGLEGCGLVLASKLKERESVATLGDAGFNSGSGPQMPVAMPG